MAGVRKKPRKNGKYQGWFTDQNGKRKFFEGTKNRAETRRMADRLEDEHRQIRLGYRPRNVSSKMRHAFPEFSVANCLFPPVSPVG